MKLQEVLNLYQLHDDPNKLDHHDHNNKIVTCTITDLDQDSDSAQILKIGGAYTAFKQPPFTIADTNVNVIRIQPSHITNKMYDVNTITETYNLTVRGPRIEIIDLINYFKDDHSYRQIKFNIDEN